jgi:hypothetical protein
MWMDLLRGGRVKKRTTCSNCLVHSKYCGLKNQAVYICQIVRSMDMTVIWMFMPHSFFPSEDWFCAVILRPQIWSRQTLRLLKNVAGSHFIIPNEWRRSLSPCWAGIRLFAFGSNCSGYVLWNEKCGLFKWQAVRGVERSYRHTLPPLILTCGSGILHLLFPRIIISYV